MASRAEVAAARGGTHVGGDASVDLLQGRGDQVVAAGEVVQDAALAHLDPLGDPGQRGVPQAVLGDRPDGGRDDLLPPGEVGERVG